MYIYINIYLYIYSAGVFHVIFHLRFVSCDYVLNVIACGSWGVTTPGPPRPASLHGSPTLTSCFVRFFRWKSILCLCLSYFKLIFSYMFGVQPIFSHMCCSFFPSSTAIFASTFPFFIGVFLPSKSAKGGRDRL